MRILHCYPHACYGGGSSYYFRSLSAELAKLHDICLLLPEAHRLDLDLPKYNWEIPFRVMASSSTYWPDAKKYCNLSEKEIAVYSDALYIGMLRAIKNFKPDLILCHFLLPSTWAGARIYGEYKIPVVTISHGADIKVLESDNRYLQANSHFLPCILQVIGVSPSHCVWIREIFNSHILSNLDCIPGGIDPEMFSPDINTSEIEKRFEVKRKNFVLGVGRFQKRKGFHILIEAASKINAPILLVGDGWEMKNLRLQIKRRQLNNVKLLGFLKPGENLLLRQLYAAAGVVAIPSLTREETLCFVGLEALASAAPVVASSIGGLSFILDNGRVGFLANPGDSDQLASSVNYLLENKSEAERLGKLGRAYIIKNFTWEKIVKRYIDLFKRIIRI